MLEELKERVLQANLELVARGLVVHTWGNVSGIDEARKHVVIKPSGVPYDKMRADDMVVVLLADGAVVDGNLKPSSDTPTHLELYRAFEAICGVAHTHSMNATAWAQARREIPALGTTHADYFHGSVPLTRTMRPEEIQTDYEANTGKVIVERIRQAGRDLPPGVLVSDHGPFSWGASAAESVFNAFVLEYVAELAARTLDIEPYPRAISPALMNKHYFRKHGDGAYYGQAGANKPH